MNPAWPIARLGDHIDLVTGYPFQSQHYVRTLDATRLLRGDNVAQGYVRWGGAQRWPIDKTDGLDDYYLRHGDVILAMDRPWIEAGLKYAAITEADLPALLVQRVARLRGHQHLRTDFLRYVIGAPSFSRYVLGIQTGTSIPHISPGQIREYRFPLPPLTEQAQIAALLGTLDAKIELNRQMNETLEAMARALFKSWFVDFDPVRAKMAGRTPFGMDAATAALFPASISNGVPAGWHAVPLDSIARFMNGLALQKFPATPEGASLPVLKIAQLRSGSVAGADRASLDVPVSHHVRDGDLIFSWSGSLLVKIWAGGGAALNQHLFKVTSDRYPRWFVHGWLQHHLPGFQSIAADKATTMGHIQRHHLSSASVVVPSSTVLVAAGERLAPVEAHYLANELESRTLAELRDLLLPKLLSGELRIRDAERLVEAAL